MAKTIEGLYGKLSRKLRSLEEDEFYQYLFNTLSGGNNEIQYSQQTLHKELDEKWLTTIEDSLESLNKVINKPRRFIKTVEEVVPTSHAKKISADSIRHLSQNTQFIASATDEEIQPTRILTVSNEETYDLYENRFVYCLIQKLISFIDQRTDIIFWTEGDEIRDVINMNSKIKGKTEDVEYKLEIIVNNHKTFAESGPDNMDLFMRIDKVRKQVLSLRDTTFYSTMNGCARVRSPIQRTNLLIKDPDYKKCYQLWQFLERYDDVGYSIDIKKSLVDFDQEFLLQMYSNLINTYTTFKSILSKDGRNLDKIKQKKHKNFKPKFVKTIQDEVVDDYNIPNVEIRQVIVEEVTEGELEAKKQIEVLKEIIKELTDEKNTISTKLDYLTRQLDQQMDLTNREIENIREKLSSEYSGQISLLEQENAGYIDELARVKRKLENTTNKNIELANMLNTRTTKLNAIGKLLQVVQPKLDGYDKIKSELESAGNNIISYQEEIKRLNKENEELRSQIKKQERFSLFKRSTS
ncbi:MAG: DUF2357 domain-containing protein [Firmicutes bacterium]|nr:DUF2357 domain-containing protein [Bacillota bacterium]